MENNSGKDFLEEELTSENDNIKSMEDTDSIDSENTEYTDNTDNAYSTETDSADTTGYADNNPESNVKATPVKSKRLIQFPLIIAACILAVAMLAFGIWKVFFDTSIEGTWVMENSSNTATPDQTDNKLDSNLYVKFSSKIVDEENGYKEISAYQGTQERYELYITDENEDGTKSLQSSMGLAGEYQVTGNWITGRTLTITAASYDGTEVQQVFRSASLPKVELPPVSDEFKVNEDVIGEWNESEFQITYTFREDGTFTCNQYGSSIVNGTYVVYEEEGKITLKYIGQEIKTFDITYSRDGDKLIIDDLGYTKVETEK